jgi:hypothetical protein
MNIIINIIECAAIATIRLLDNILQLKIPK